MSAEAREFIDATFQCCADTRPSAETLLKMRWLQLPGLTAEQALRRLEQRTRQAATEGVDVEMDEAG